ncbi:MAG TPA: PAS domain-containing protein, partial [Isosphaeraceae bacterium]|nr:PAS domain-containing protein [Isosphaeraceae bacterium]
MTEKPRVLMIERVGRSNPEARKSLGERCDVVVVHTMARALALLRQQQFEGVYVDTVQLNAVRWAGLLIQSDEILEAIADGVAVVDPNTTILWTNPEFQKLVGPEVHPTDLRFYRALGNPEILGPEPCPFTSALSSRKPASTVLRLDTSRYLRLTVTPVMDTG